MIHKLENDIPRAIEMYRAAIEVSPDNVDLATDLGLLYMKIGENQKAFEQFGSALARNADCVKALFGTGLMMQVKYILKFSSNISFPVRLLKTEDFQYLQLHFV